MATLNSLTLGYVLDLDGLIIQNIIKMVIKLNTFLLILNPNLLLF